ncbi:MAG: histidine phosphatase family protein [Actinomycetota bacterium]
MTDVLFVRHGQSEWNAQGRWQGQADPPLSQLGIDQARAAGRHLRDWPAFDGIASSTLDRAATTADQIADELGFDIPFRTVDLAERSAGEWSGLTRDEIDRDYPGYLKSRRYPPGYEYDDDLLPRIRRGLLSVLTNVPGERLVVVAHGGLLYCIEASFGLSFNHLSNLGARWLHVDHDASIELGERVELLDGWDGEQTSNPGML